MELSIEGAAFVDQHVSSFAHRLRPAQLRRVVEEAIARHMPELADEAAREAADRRHVTVIDDEISFAGTMRVEAELDLADALDFEAAVARGAAEQRALGSEEPLGARRARAVGEMSRSQLALDLAAADASASVVRRPARQHILYLHLSESAVTGGSGGLECGRLDSTRAIVTADQVRAWLGEPGTSVVVKPVIDLADHVRVDQWEVPDRIAERVQLRDGHCVFPWCTRPARSCRADQRGCDCDHVDPHARGGPTCPCNLAPLCRRHHRLKTHSRWRYDALEPGSYLWTSPHGYQFLVDHEGTLDVSADRRRLISPSAAARRSTRAIATPPRTPLARSGAQWRAREPADTALSPLDRFGAGTTEGDTVIELTRGQELALTTEAGEPLTRIKLGLGWDKERTAGFIGTGAPEIDLDVSAIQFAGGQLFDLAFFNNLATRDGSVVHLGDNLSGSGEGDDEVITVDLPRVHGPVDTIVVLVSSYQGHTLEWIAARLLPPGRRARRRAGPAQAHRRCAPAGHRDGRRSSGTARAAGGCARSATGSRSRCPPRRWTRCGPTSEPRPAHGATWPRRRSDRHVDSPDDHVRRAPLLGGAQPMATHLLAQHARLSVAGTSMTGLLLVTLGGGLVARDAERVHDIGMLSLDSPALVWGVLLFGLGGLFLVLSVVAIGVSLGLALADRY